MAKKIKISVIKPPSNNRRIYPSLGLGYLVSFLRKEGFDADFIDTTMIDFPFHLLDGIPRLYWKEARRIDWGRISAYFMGTEPIDIALINASFTADIYNTAGVARILKERNRSCLTVVGGTHVSALPRQTLEEFPEIDMVVMGEGEYTARDLINAFLGGGNFKGLKGIAYRDKEGKIIVEERADPIPDIDNIPFPCRSAMPMDKYRMVWSKIQTGPAPGLVGDPAGIVFSSRGCTGHCLFCASREISSGCMRLRSAGSILSEIEELIREYKIKNLGFLDDFFTSDAARTLEICRVLKELKIKWYCYARADTVSEELLREMKRSGCVLVNYGLESGDQGILNMIAKGLTLKQISNAIKATRRVGLKYVASFTLGMPGESKETVRKTLKLAKTFGGIDAGIYRITPYPGSPLYRMAIKNNWIISNRWDLYDDSAVSEVVYVPPGWSKEEFQNAFTMARKELDRRYRLSRLIRTRSVLRRIPYLITGLFRHAGEEK